MDPTLDKLDRLAALHQSGALTDEEFAAQKTLLFSAPVESPTAIAAPSTPRLGTAWQRRFDFFTEYGSPYSGAGAKALRQLPFWVRHSIASNIWGFVLGPFYLLLLGLWKRGLVIAGTAIIVSFFAEQTFGDAADMTVATITGAFCAATVNYARFIKVTRGRDRWNPLAELFGSARG